jgi:hypothetical protein
MKPPVNLSKATQIEEDEMKAVMDYHPWDADKISKGNAVRAALSEALCVIIRCVPPSADRTTAIRKLREARMDCNSAITHDGAY